MFTLCLLEILIRKRGRANIPQDIEKYKKNWSGRHRPNIAYKLLIFMYKLINAPGGTVKGTVKKPC